MSAIKFSVKGKGWEQFYDRQKQIVEQHKRIPLKAVQRATALVVRRIKQKITNKKLIKSNRYRASINGVVQKIAEDAARGVVGTWMHYAIYLEEGTKAHIISPKRGDRLLWKQDGKTVAARYVYHPGTKAYKIFEETLAESFDDIINIIIDELKKIK